MKKEFQSKIIFTLFFLILFILNPVSAQQGSWSQKTNFGGSPRAKVLSFSIGTKGYIGTGNNGSDLNDFWEYDSLNDTWTQKANLSLTPRSCGVGFSIDNKGYAGLGISYLQPKGDFWEYNPQSNIWTQKADYPGLGKIRAVAFSINNFGYVGTGSSISTIGNETKEFWQYNPVTDTWIQKADFGGHQRDRAVGFSLLSKGYIGTGYQYDGNNPSELGDFWEYDPIADSWTQKTSIPELKRNNAIGFATSTKGYIGMGYPNKTDFWQYSPDTDSWLQMTDFAGPGRIFATGFAIGNKGYGGMGYSVSNQGTTTFYNDLWEFNEQLLDLLQILPQDAIEVYPNPVSDFINLSSNTDIIEIILYDSNGREQCKTNTIPIDMSSLSSGHYFLKINTYQGVFIKKIVKN